MRRTWNLSRKRLKNTTKPATRLEGGLSPAVAEPGDVGSARSLNLWKRICTTSASCTLVIGPIPVTISPHYVVYVCVSFPATANYNSP